MNVKFIHVFKRMMTSNCRAMFECRLIVIYYNFQLYKLVMPYISRGNLFMTKQIQENDQAQQIPRTANSNQ